MDILLDFLLKNGYKKLDDQIFYNKCQTLSGTAKTNNKVETLYLSHPRDYELNLKEKYIDTYELDLSFIQEMKTLEKGISDENNARFLLYNKIIFNDDIFSITQVLHDKKAIEDIVIYFDYEYNQMLLNLALNNLDTNNDEIIYLEHLVFYNNKAQKEPIKGSLLLKILEKNEKFFIKILQSLVEYWEGFIANSQYKYCAIAFMLEEFLKKYHVEEKSLSENKAYLILNNLYLEREDLAKYFSDKEYYGYQLLTKYSEIYNLLKEENSDEEDIVKPNFIIGDILLVYDHPDFNSFSREILVKGEVEYLNKASGWDYVKINGTIGYLPQESKRQNTHSFLADEEG